MQQKQQPKKVVPNEYKEEENCESCFPSQDNRPPMKLATKWKNDIENRDPRKPSAEAGMHDEGTQ